LELTREEESALKGEQGEIMQTAYRILVATGEATDAEKLIPIEWAHLSGVNYNTIGDAGEETEQELMKKIQKKYWLEINDTFVMFGQNICKPISPMCNVCKIKKSCKYYKSRNAS